MSIADESDRVTDSRAAALVPGDPYASDPARPATSARGPWWRWLFLLPGLAAVLYGGYGLLTAGERVPLPAWATWFVGSALLNDLVIAPLWIALGWLSTKILPRPARPAAVVGVAVAGVLTLIALPYVLGPGAAGLLADLVRGQRAAQRPGARPDLGGPGLAVHPAAAGAQIGRAHV